MKSSPLPVWGEAGRGADGWHIPDPAGQFASSYVGMGNNPVIAVDPDGRWAVGGQWYWSEAYKQAQRTVADFQKQLMESFSMEEVEREMQRLEMMDYAKKHGIGQGEGDSDLNTDGTGDGDKPGITNQESQVGEHLIGPILILLGQRLIFLKPFSALGSKAGSSIASLTLSQLLPLRSPFIKQVTTSIFGLESSTAVLGRGLGRLTPGLGWAMTAWDVNYNLIPLAVEKFIILPYWSPSTVKENKINVGHWAEVGVCFRAGTLVSSTNGFVPIEKIKIGDTVLSYNLEKSKIEQKKVENVFKQETQEIYELNTNNQKIFVTAQHPFYVEGKGWVKVQYLQKGDMLKAKDDAQEKLLQIVLLKQKEIVYNIEVEGNHNYFITKSNIMVHNK